EALRLRPNYPRARATLGADLVRIGDHQRGLALLEEAVGSEPESVEIHYRLGETLDGLGDLDGAASPFDRATRPHPGPGEAWAKLGMVRLRQGHDDKAVECLARSVERRPASFDALRERLSAGGRADLAARVEERLRNPERSRPAGSP